VNGDDIISGDWEKLKVGRVKGQLVKWFKRLGVFFKGCGSNKA
jgi:hypothetical protein